MNIIIFGPNGSGKGTQAYFLEKHFHLQHVEAGGIFRYNISHNTDIGKKVKEYLDKGALVPDAVTNPMMLTALQEVPTTKGWLLDGYPRNKNQAMALITALQEHNTPVHYIIELLLDRDIAKQRLLGRKTCSQDASHSNNTSIPSIAPLQDDICRICNAPLLTRADDIDEEAIDTRHTIYYDNIDGTCAALSYCKEILCDKGTTKYITINAMDDIKVIQKSLYQQLL